MKRQDIIDNEIIKNKYSIYGTKIPELLEKGLTEKQIEYRLVEIAFHIPISTWIPHRCGLKIQFIYKRKGWHTIQFEDGYTINSRKMHTEIFTAKHPTLRTNQPQAKRVHTKGTFAGFYTRYILTNENGAYYSCVCQKCGLKEVMTPQQMMSHQNKCSPEPLSNIL